MAIPFVFFGSSAVGTIFTTYGKVNGLEVTQSDYNAANNAVNQRMVQAYGEDFSPDQFPDDVLLQMVKEEIITQKTLLSETQDLGIFVSDTDAKKDIMMSPNFQTDSQFDQIAFETAIRTQGYTPNDYIAMVQEGKAKNFLIDALTSSFFTLDSEIVNIAKLIEQERDVSFTKIDFNLLKNGVTADLTEAQSFYDSNSLQFYSDESRSMNYILLDNSKYRSLVEVPENYVQEAYSDYLQRLNMRSEKRASHIMVDLMNYSSKAEANKTIELAQNKLNEGDSFNEVVLAFSEDLISKEEEGDIGYSAGDVFPDEFEKALSDMSIGDISEILFSEATNSFHILKLTEINKEDAKSFDEMKDVLLEELVSAESMALMDEDRDIIDNAILDNQSIEDIALLLDLEILSSNETTLFDFDFEIKDQRISQALFGFPEGLNSPEIIELNDVVMVMDLNTIKPAELMPFETVTEQAFDLVKSEKALALSLSVQVSLNTDDSVDTSASYISKDAFVGVKRFSSLLPAEVLEQAFLASVNSQFVSSARNGDTYLMTVTAVNSPDEEFLDAMVEEFKEFSSSQVSNKMATLIMDEMRNSAKVNLQNL
tara:strand:+ start:1040 stop:2827 length:1788 start_codon:yes stop_codon:yes gene_type:complete